MSVDNGEIIDERGGYYLVEHPDKLTIQHSSGELHGVFPGTPEGMLQAVTRLNWLCTPVIVVGGDGEVGK